MKSPLAKPFPEELPDPVDVIRRDMQRAADALSKLRSTLQTVTGEVSFYPPLAPADEPLKKLSQQLKELVDRADEELAGAARRFVRHDIRLWFKSG